MSAQIKFSPTHIVLDYVKSRTLSVTRQEIIKGTGLAADQVRKATNQLVAKGSLATELDNVGVTYYMTPEANMKKVRQEPPVLVSNNAELYDQIKDYKPTKTEHAWDTLVEEAEQRGFAKGYAVGIQEAQRAAYADGKKAVINKLEALLS